MCETFETFTTNTKNHIWTPFEEIIQSKKAQLQRDLARKIKERANGSESAWHNLPYSMSITSQWRRLAKEYLWVGATA